MMVGTEEVVKPESVTRTINIDLEFPQEQQELKAPTIASIRAYRAALRHCFGFYMMSQFSGATLQWTSDDDCRLNPVNDSARVIAALSSGQSQAALIPIEGERVRGAGDTYQVQIGRGPVYELREELVRVLPNAMSYVLDSARRDINTAARSLDPQFKRATRAWLILQGARQFARFNYRGIGLPKATARPRLEGYRLILKWDRQIGDVSFKVPTLDPSRRHIWRSLADGDDGWTLGTIFLTERDGKIKAVISYSCPKKSTELDLNRMLRVNITDTDPDNLFSISGPDGASTVDTISILDVQAFLQYQLMRRIQLEKRRGACGNPRRPWGFRKGWQTTQETLDRATMQRLRGVTDRNHAWTRRIATRAQAWRCGVVEVGPFPERSFNEGAIVGCIGNHPWNWTEFKSHLKYKIEEMGGSVIFVD